MVRDLEQISRNSYILVGVIEILRQNDVYLITTECDLNAELINSGWNALSATTSRGHLSASRALMSVCR